MDGLRSRWGGLSLVWGGWVEIDWGGLSRVIGVEVGVARFEVGLRWVGCEPTRVGRGWVGFRSSGV